MAEYQLPKEYEFVDQFYDPPKNASERVERAIKNTSGEAYKRTAEVSKAQTKAIAPPQIDQEVDIPEGYDVIEDEPEVISDEPVDFDFGTMVENIPDSAAKYGSDIVDAVSSPVQTIKGLVQAAVGGAQKLIPGQSGPDDLFDNYEPVADAVGQHFTDRYGSFDDVKRSLMTDPVGVVGDAAGLLGGVGMLPKMAKAGKIASMLDPASLAVTSGTKLAANLPGVRSLPTMMYQKAAKFPSRFDEAAVTQTALNNSIMPTPGGIEKAESIISGANDSLTKLIDESGKAGEYVSTNSVFKALDDVKKEVGGFKLNAPDDVVKVDAEINKFKDYLNTEGMDFVTIKEVQDFKTDLYDRINFNRKNNTATPVDEALRKNLAKSAKEEIELNIPEAKDLNMTMGEMIELTEALKQPSSTIGRNNFVSIAAPLNATAGAMAAGPLGGITGFTLAMLGNRAIKARLSLQLQKIKKQNISNAKKKVLFFEAIRNEAAMNEEQAQQ